MFGLSWDAEGVRRGCLDKAAAACQVFSHALYYPGRTNGLSSASIKSTNPSVRTCATCKRNVTTAIGKQKDPALDRLYLFVAITDRCGVHGDRPRLLTVHMMLLTTAMI